jgi:hypothetical protein
MEKGRRNDNLGCGVFAFFSLNFLHMYMALPLISLHHPGTTAGIESRGGQEKNKSLIPPTKSCVIPRAASGKNTCLPKTIHVEIPYISRLPG